MERPLDLGRVVGTTFTPSVDASGNLSWTNDGGLTNPATVNIKGPPGSAANACKLGGPVTFAALPALTADNAGLIVNVSDAFTTTNDFLGGSGTSCPAGTNVIIIALKTVSASGDSWTLYSDGQLFISGDGGLWDAPEPWRSYASQITSVILQEGVTETGYYAFFGYDSDGDVYERLTSVYLPVSLEYVREGAFSNLENLTDVYYAGTQAQWENVTINNEGPEPFDNATIHYESALPSETSYYKYNVLSGAVAATAAPLMDGTAAVGSSTAYALEDHVHPSDTSRASAADVTKIINLLKDAIIYKSLSSRNVSRALAFDDAYPENLREVIFTQLPHRIGVGTQSSVNIRPIAYYASAGIIRTGLYSVNSITVSIDFRDSNNNPIYFYGGIANFTTGKLTITHANIESYNSETLPGVWWSDRDVYEEGAIPTIGAQVVYELDPSDYQTYTFPAQQIKPLDGYNLIYPNRPDSFVTVEYRVDTAVALS